MPPDELPGRQLRWVTQHKGLWLQAGRLFFLLLRELGFSALAIFLRCLIDRLNRARYFTRRQWRRVALVDE